MRRLTVWEIERPLRQEINVDRCVYLLHFWFCAVVSSVLHPEDTPWTVCRVEKLRLTQMPSGAGATLWQVILGRAIAGLGGAGMTSLVSVLIAGKTDLCF